MHDVPRSVGIDLGTTYSAIAHLDDTGRPIVVPNRHGDLVTPSVVLFEADGTVVVGLEAKKAAAFEPHRVVACVKRDMGANRISQQVDGRALSPQEVSAIILRRLKQDFEDQIGPISEAVITVPAYFDDQRRKATREAGEIAGLKVSAVLNEPVSAALAFALQDVLGSSGISASQRALREAALRERTSLVFDLGGGTFDVTIVRSDGKRVTTIATDGDVQLGGKDWDDRLAKHLRTLLLQDHGVDATNSPSAMAVLSEQAEEAKRSLSSRSTVPVRFHINKIKFTTELTREQFNELTADLLEQTRITTELVVEDSGLSWQDINHVLAVGGSTKMPMVRQLLHEVSGREPDSSLAADLAVAQGAAIYAAMLATKRRQSTALDSEPIEELPFEGEVLATLDEIEVHHVNSHSLGVVARSRSGQKINSILIKKNSPIPRSVRKTYGLEKAGATSLRVHVLEGEAQDPHACSVVGECLVDELPSGLPRGAPIQVTCRYDADGRIHVEAKELTSGHDARIEIFRPHGLPVERKQEITQAIARLVIE